MNLLTRWWRSLHIHVKGLKEGIRQSTSHQQRDTKEESAELEALLETQIAELAGDIEELEEVREENHYSLPALYLFRDLESPYAHQEQREGIAEQRAACRRYIQTRTTDCHQLGLGNLLQEYLSTYEAFTRAMQEVESREDI
ncbi:hypothetical protein HYZ97_04505 [Candidatus Pacearchaeota archaeon]|nr:hypothetical protein [Candidatus Pacearchaeota archaeon]